MAPNVNRRSRKSKGLLYAEVGSNSTNAVESSPQTSATEFTRIVDDRSRPTFSFSSGMLPTNATVMQQLAASQARRATRCRPI
jgi:hypothetical protein